MKTGLTYQEAAEFLGVNKFFVKALVGRNEVSSQRLGHRTVRIPKSSLEAYLKRCEVIGKHD